MGFFSKATSVFNPSKWGGSDDPLFGGPLGDMIPGVGDARAQDQANRVNIHLAKQNRDWQERMSNSAYQRAMTDMKKAGLNPMLAYQQGGAPVPSTAAATVNPSSKTGLASAGVSAFTGISTARAAQQNAQTQEASAESNIRLQDMQTAKTVAETQHVQAETKLKQRELRGKGVKDTLDREGGKIIQSIMDKLQNSATPDDSMYKKFMDKSNAGKKMMNQDHKFKKLKAIMASPLY